VLQFPRSSAPWISRTSVSRSGAGDARNSSDKETCDARQRVQAGSDVDGSGLPRRDAVTGGKRYRQWGGFPTRRAAEQALTRQLELLRVGVYADAGTTTLGDFLDRWLESVGTRDAGGPVAGVRKGSLGAAERRSAMRSRHESCRGQEAQ